MDKNSIIGIVLIAVILIVWGIVNSPSQEEREALSRANDTIAAGQPAPATVQAINDTITIQESAAVAESSDSAQVAVRLGAFASLSEGKEEFRKNRAWQNGIRWPRRRVTIWKGSPPS